MAQSVTLALTQDQLAMLDEIARERSQPPERLVSEIVEEWLQYEIEVRKAVQAGLEEADEGLLEGLEEALEDLRQEAEGRSDAPG